MPPAAGGFAPKPPNTAPHCEFLSTHRQLCTVSIYMIFCSFCFEQFFLDRSVANLIMLIIAVCLMLYCFVFEKSYLHYALCDFDSILLHCTKLFICQSIDREQFLMSHLKPPPIEKSCVRHCGSLPVASLKRTTHVNGDF